MQKLILSILLLGGVMYDPCYKGPIEIIQPPTWLYPPYYYGVPVPPPDTIYYVPQPYYGRPTYVPSYNKAARPTTRPGSGR